MSTQRAKLRQLLADLSAGPEAVAPAFMEEPPPGWEPEPAAVRRFFSELLRGTGDVVAGRFIPHRNGVAPEKLVGTAQYFGVDLRAIAEELDDAELVRGVKKAIAEYQPEVQL